MNRNHSSSALAVLLLAIFAFSAIATPATAGRRLSESELRALPGFVDFGDVWKFSDGDEEVEVELSQPLLGVVAPFLRGEDPELADLILDLHLVKVNAFSFDSDDEKSVVTMMRDSADELRDDGWDNVVKVRGEDENVNVFVRIEGDGSDDDTFLSGLAVLYVGDDNEAAFVNVVGHFRMQDIARLSEQYNLPHSQDWSDLKEEMHKHDRRGEGNE
jgi:Domain of unknown function (DUF4252)